jgi:tRNA (Uracil-5-)-methyltransferase
VLPGLAEAGTWSRADVVVLDPPRAGAGRAVLEAVLALHPRVVVYVACDPASLARDVATATTRGYRLAAVRALDLFPMTQHVECVAALVPEAIAPPGAGGPQDRGAGGLAGTANPEIS